MGLTEKQIAKIRDELDNCKRPLYFFHGDQDGLCSFLLLYKYVKEGKGVVVNARPRIDEKFLRKVEEYQPDKIFILDVAIVDQEFIDKVHVPVIWIDHHDPLERDKVKYFNPRVADAQANIPASYLCYQVVREDLWIAMVGCIGDWYMPDFKDEFCEAYPGLLSKKVKMPQVALFDSKLGTLTRIFGFMLKGRISEALKCAKILTRIESPYEILDQTSPKGKYIYKYFENINKEYKSVLAYAVKEIAKQKKTKKKILVLDYVAGRMSFTGELSNELLYRNPNNIIIITREQDGDMKSSLRSPADINLAGILAKALFGIEGYGGGHEHACGACIKKEDWEQFLVNLEDELEKSKEK
ncbi:MAG: DHHA1 domain-containing protein [Nanoarchaeota archaeon]|nr:DHHA1 domain-containing protein [Nanoarchaeota archaeon]